MDLSHDKYSCTNTFTKTSEKISTIVVALGDNNIVKPEPWKKGRHSTSNSYFETYRAERNFCAHDAIPPGPYATLKLIVLTKG